MEAIENPIVKAPIKDDALFGVDATGEETFCGEKILVNDVGEFIIEENAAEYLIQVLGWELKEAGEE